jgi:hypothetical protein
MGPFLQRRWSRLLTALATLLAAALFAQGQNLAAAGTGLLVIGFLGWAILLERRSRKAVEARLARQTSILASVLEGMSEAVLVLGADHSVIISNPAARSLLGDPPVLFDDFPLRQALAGKKIGNLTMMMKDADGGTSKFLDTNARPLLDAQGGILGGVIVFHDITELKQNEDALLNSISQDISELKNEEVALIDSNKALEQRVGLLKLHSRDTLALSRLVESLQTCRSKDEICAAAAKSLSGFIEPSYGALHLLDASGVQLERAVIWGGQSASAPSFPSEAAWPCAAGRPA